MSDIFEKFNLTNKVAIVTGGVGLLGNQFCRTLSQAGAKVVIADINKQATEVLVEEIESLGGEAIGYQLDVTDPESTTRMAIIAKETFGRIDILVNSAALDPKFDKDNEDKQGANAFESFPLDVWKQSLDVNLTGLFLCSQAVATEMRNQGTGSIINICSTYGLVGPDQRLYEREGQPKQFKPITYTVTKAGVVGLTKYLATYYAGTAIRINSLTPGGVFNNHDDEFNKAYSSRAVMGRMAHQDEMNGAILFLASEASSYMTGSNLVVDGGWTAW